MPEDQGFHKIFNSNSSTFEQTALEIFRFQVENNPVYKAFTGALGIQPVSVSSILDIPFLPVRFFKTHPVKTGDPIGIGFDAARVFESSGTSDSINSRHYVKDISFYEESFTRCFELFYGSVKDHCILGLLPSYLERDNSSLVYMVDKLIRLSGHPQSGFYLDEWDKLDKTLNELEIAGQRTLLIGVTFALLDFADKYPLSLKHTTIMETGGMKGRKREMIREEVHASLKKAFELNSVHSEYGMTELLSQAYSKGEGIFSCPPWMRILVRDEEDPFLVRTQGSGTINIIDLANIYSCSFIATDDAGKLDPDGSFEIHGRIDGSDIRGCSLMTI